MRYALCAPQCLSLPHTVRQRGFTMVETLVALVVLAIGLLGIAALHLESLRAGRTAIYRTQAVNLAADVADRIRANRVALLDYAVNYATVPAPVMSAARRQAAVPGFWLRPTSRCGRRKSPEPCPVAKPSEVTAPAVAGDPATYLVTIRWNEVSQDEPLEFQLGFTT